VGGKILVRHPFVESKRAYVCPCKVEPLYQEYWGANGVSQQFATLQELKYAGLAVRRFVFSGSFDEIVCVHI